MSGHIIIVHKSITVVDTNVVMHYSNRLGNNIRTARGDVRKH